MFGDQAVRKRLREVEERVEKLEMRAAEDKLVTLELMEKISRRLEWRERKRVEAAEPGPGAGDELQHALGFSRRFGGTNGGR